MKKLSAILFITAFGCASSNSIVVQPIKPTPVPLPVSNDTVIVIKHDTLSITRLVHDTSYLQLPPIVINNNPDSIIYISAIGGDNYYLLQSAVDYAIKNHLKIRLNRGVFQISKPLVFADTTGGAFHQISFDFEGAVSAMNTPNAYCSIIQPTFNDAPAICIQDGKGGVFKNVSIDGRFRFPDYLNYLQVDTLKASEWTDGQCRDNVTSPYAGIAIDPFSDIYYYDSVRQPYPTLLPYYLSGVNRAGSTGIRFDGLAIKHFIVDFIITPSNQQNGDLISLENSQLESAVIAYATTQAQSKLCSIKNLEVWAPVRTVIDNWTYGFHHGDGSIAPVLDGLNMASTIHQIFNVVSPNFTFEFMNIYGEGIFKYGLTTTQVSGSIINAHIDFNNADPNTPSPDFYIMQGATTNINCTYRIYPGLAGAKRISVNNFYQNGNNYIGGSFNLPPMCYNFLNHDPLTKFYNVSMYNANGTINSNSNDSISSSDKVVVHINKGNWTGWFSTTSFGIGSANVGDMVISVMQMEDLFAPTVDSHIVGYVDSVSKGYVHMCNMAYGINDNQEYSIKSITLKKTIQ